MRFVSLKFYVLLETKASSVVLPDFFLVCFWVFRYDGSYIAAVENMDFYANLS